MLLRKEGVLAEHTHVGRLVDVWPRVESELCDPSQAQAPATRKSISLHTYVFSDMMCKFRRVGGGKTRDVCSRIMDWVRRVRTDSAHPADPVSFFMIVDVPVNVPREKHDLQKKRSAAVCLYPTGHGHEYRIEDDGIRCDGTLQEVDMNKLMSTRSLRPPFYAYMRAWLRRSELSNWLGPRDVLYMNDPDTGVLHCFQPRSALAAPSPATVPSAVVADCLEGEAEVSACKFAVRYGLTGRVVVWSGDLDIVPLVHLNATAFPFGCVILFADRQVSCLHVVGSATVTQPMSVTACPAPGSANPPRGVTVHPMKPEHRQARLSQRNVLALLCLGTDYVVKSPVLRGLRTKTVWETCSDHLSTGLTVTDTLTSASAFKDVIERIYAQQLRLPPTAGTTQAQIVKALEKRKAKTIRFPNVLDVRNFQQQICFNFFYWKNLSWKIA